MEDRQLLEGMRAFENDFQISSKSSAKPWLIKLFRLIRFMDISQTIESDLIHGLFLLIQSLQQIYYLLSIYVLCFN